jgi:K+/H+ antiporter YhaU regulatory subunit KhtT
MEVREVELPGIGMKFSFETEEGETICVIIHKTGAARSIAFSRLKRLRSPSLSSATPKPASWAPS